MPKTSTQYCRKHQIKIKEMHLAGLLIIPDFSKCSQCKKEKPRDLFYMNLNVRKGLDPICKECKNDRLERYARNKGFKDRTADTRARLKYYYGITIEEFDEMMSRQSSKCMICKAGDKRLLVDHCHDTGKVRGLLCHRCNTGLAHIERSGFVDACASYLEKF